MSDPSDMPVPRPAHDVLTKAGIEAGVPTTGAELIRDGANVLYRLPGRAVARIGRAGSYDTAAHLIRVSRWLATTDVDAVRLVDGVQQPTMVGDRPVTWWVQLPDHRHATPFELGATLTRLHALTPPDTPPLAVLDPFTGLDDTITTAPTLTDRDRTWLTNLLTRLRHEYAELQPGLPRHVIHGDAWQGNLAVLDTGIPVLMDLDHLGLGPREWDLVPLAVDHTDFARITTADYVAFVDAYGGYDVTDWPGYRTLATIMELRWTAFVLGKTSTDLDAANEGNHRLACLRGDIESPWQWTAF